MKRNLLFLSALLIVLNVQSQYKGEIIIEQVLKSDTTSIGQKIVYPQVQDAEVTIAKITFPPGSSTGWHKHDIPVFAYVMQGELTVELEEGRIVHFKQGSSFAEVFDTFHNGINNGKEDLVLIAFYMGEKGKALSKSK
jgi:quercetin dioxygenase-like cupin family protein